MTDDSNDTQRPDTGQKFTDFDAEHCLLRSNHLAEQLYQNGMELLSAANRSADLCTNYPGTDFDSRRDLALAHRDAAIAIGALVASVLFSAGQLHGLAEGRQASE
jgi:hypothetical protein